MLKELYNVDWTKLKHAYGSAGDIPKLLEKLI